MEKQIHIILPFHTIPTIHDPIWTQFWTRTKGSGILESLGLSSLFRGDVDLWSSIDAQQKTSKNLCDYDLWKYYWFIYVYNIQNAEINIFSESCDYEI